MMLEKIRGTKNVQAKLDDLIEASQAAQVIKHPFRNLLQRKNRPQLSLRSSSSPGTALFSPRPSLAPEPWVRFRRFSVWFNDHEFSPRHCALHLDGLGG
ncbi:hypothetical protein MLD38_036398 [Melastoma candidum]|nr:hypothetical protein MLD38_036398 [Melastoma candidum]